MYVAKNALWKVLQAKFDWFCLHSAAYYHEAVLSIQDYIYNL